MDELFIIEIEETRCKQFHISAENLEEAIKKCELRYIAGQEEYVIGEQYHTNTNYNDVSHLLE